MPPVYQVSNDKKVTVRKILAMRNHWYKAASTSVEAHIATLQKSKAKELSKLKATYTSEASYMPDPHPETGARLDDYVPADEYATYFDPKLPFNLADEIRAAYAADMQGSAALAESELKTAMAIDFIRAANQDETSWTTIKALMHDPNRQEYYLSTLTPVNQEFDLTYHKTKGSTGKTYGKTGLTSMNERIPPAIRTKEEQERPANFWYSELHVSDANQTRGEELFAAFRSGAFSAYAVDDKSTRKAANLQRALGVMEAMVIKKLQMLPYPTDFLDSDHILPLTVVNINLLSDTSILGDATMVADHHKALRALDGREVTFKIKRRNLVVEPPIIQHAVKTSITMLDFNIAVNQANTFVLSSVQADTNKPNLLRLKNHVKNQRDKIARRIEQLETQRDKLQKAMSQGGGGTTKDYNQLSNILADLGRMERIDRQIQKLWQSIKGTAMGEYVTPARLANLAYLIGLTVHFNCKSGKDRTGLMDIESKFLARELYIKREVDTSAFDDELPDLVLNPDEKYRHQQMLWESGSLQILERNTRGQSLKVADMKNIPGSSDAALRDRLGGNAMLADLNGLAKYTLLVDDMLK
jgi:hypothetical protein